MHDRADGSAAGDTREDQDKGDAPGHGCTAWSEGASGAFSASPACFRGHGRALGDAAARGCAANPFPETGRHHIGTEAVRGSAGHWRGEHPKAGAVQGRSPRQSVRTPQCHVKGILVSGVCCRGVWGPHGVPGPAAKPLQFLGKCLELQAGQPRTVPATDSPACGRCCPLCQRTDPGTVPVTPKPRQEPKRLPALVPRLGNTHGSVIAGARH